MFQGFDANHAPKAPYTVNLDSPQARNLQRWWPCMEPHINTARFDDLGVHYQACSVVSGVTATDFVASGHFNNIVYKGNGSEVLNTNILNSTDPHIDYSDITIMHWYKPLEDQTAVRVTMYANAQIGLFHGHTSASFRGAFVTHDGGGFHTTGDDAAITFATNEWAHFAGSYDKTTMRAFKNGVKLAEVAKTHSINGTDSALGLYAAGDGTFDTSMLAFDFRIYSPAISDELVFEIGGNPDKYWDLYKPIDRRNYLSIVAGTSVPVFMHHYKSMRAA